MESPSSLPVDKNYVLVVDNNGDTDIFNLSYDTNWEDVSVMLQVKFGHESMPVFTYIDEEDDIISLDSQEAFEEAVKIAKENNDVLHVQMRKFGTPIVRPCSHTSEANKSIAGKVDVKAIKIAVGNTVEWVRSTFNRRLDNSISEDTCRSGSVVDSSSESDIHEDNTASNAADETDTQVVVNREDGSDETSVKEPVESSYSSGEISVPTSLMTEEDDTEVVVKMPIASTSQQCNFALENTSLALQDEMLQKLKEEVRTAISQELSAFKQELGTSVVQRADGMTKSTASITNEGPRTPRQIKDEIKLLRKEMKEAKQLKKLNKQRSTEIPISGSPTEESLRRARKYAASFICENLIDGSRVMIGQQFVKYWVLKNEGTSVWDHVIELKFIEESPVGEGSPVDPVTSSQDEEGSFAPDVETNRRCLWGPEKLSVPMPIVEMNGTAVIAVRHVAPNFPCTYNSVWRLSHNGRLFGPSIWCSVKVTSEDEILCEHQAADVRSSSSANSTDQETSRLFVVGNWATRKPSVNDEAADTHSDKLSDMLSFEMTAVADFNKATVAMPGSDSPHNLPYIESIVTSSDKITETPRPEPVGQVGAGLEARSSTGAVVRDELFEELISDFESVEFVSHNKTLQENGICDQEDEVAANEDAERDQDSGEELGAKDILVEEENDEDVAENDEDTNEDIEQKYEETSQNLSGREDDEDHDKEDEKVPDDKLEEKEEVELDEDDRSSEMSDFEVIPIPECFDTTRPLAASEDAENKDENSAVMLPGSPSWEEVDEQLQRHDEDPPGYQDVAQVEDQVEVDEDASSETQEKTQPLESTANDANPTLLSTCETQEKSPVLVFRSIPFLETYSLPRSNTFAPGQARSLGTRCSVTNKPTDPNEASYTEDSVKRSSYQPPVPLPRSTVDAIKADVVVAGETSHISQPRSAAILPQRDLLSDSSLNTQLSVQDQDVQVHSEEIEEFTSASETLASPTRHSPPIYVDPSHIEEGANSTGSAPQPLSPMEQLVDMGFFDIDMNRDLLHAFEGDMTRVVNALIHRAPDDGARDDGTFIA